MEEKQKSERIGALWKKTSKNGVEYYSGNVNGEEIFVTVIQNPSTDKSPDLVIYKKDKNLERK